MTQQERPATFEPKIAQLYDELFQRDEQTLDDSSGFWREFFLLKPDRARLRIRLQSLDSTDLLHLQHDSQQLFCRAVAAIKSGKAPSDENGLDV